MLEDGTVVDTSWSTRHVAVAAALTQAPASAILSGKHDVSRVALIYQVQYCTIHIYGIIESSTSAFGSGCTRTEPTTYRRYRQHHPDHLHHPPESRLTTHPIRLGR